MIVQFDLGGQLIHHTICRKASVGYIPFSLRTFLQFTYSWIDELIPKLKDNGSLYIFNTPYNSAFILQYLIK